MAKEVRQVVFEFLGDAGDLASESDKAARDLGKADKAAASTANTLTTKLKPAAIAAGTAAAAMAAKWALEGIGMAQTAEVAAASFEKVFGPAAEGLSEELEDQRLALGLSEAEFQKQVTAIGAVSLSLHQTEEEAAAFAASMFKVAGDVAAFNGDLGSSDEVIEAMNAALIGNTQSLEKYGIEVTAAMVKTRALADSGKTAESELTQLEKREATMALITEQAALMTGSLSEQMDSAAVKSNEFSARMADVQTQVGAALLPLKELVLEVLLAMIPILEALNPLITALGNVIGGLVKFLTPVIQAVGKLIELLIKLGREADKALDKLNPFNNGSGGFSLPSFHSGGTVPGATGSQQMIMAQGGEKVVPASQRGSGGGGGGTVINVNVTAGLSNPQETARTIVDMLESYTATNGPVSIKVR